MPEINPKVEVVVLIHRKLGETKVEFVSPSCGSDILGELWVEQIGSFTNKTSSMTICFEKDVNTENMISPINQKLRLCFVGTVSGVIPCDIANYAEISKATFSIT